MSVFIPKTLCILGRQPALGLAELESLYGAEHVSPIEGAALLDIDNSELDWRRLGGSLKIAKVLTELPYTNWNQLSKYLVEQVPAHLQHAPDGKFTIGLSVYNLPVEVNDINRAALAIKKRAKIVRPIRVVPNKATELNSAQVIHNKLTSLGAWELLLVGDGQCTWLAQTMYVQDIEAYAARDQARPQRDSRVGMLPPKLAQTIINLAKPKFGGTVLDPFCGTGVVLQEALLMGYNVMGSDLEKRMVEYSAANLDWLKQKVSAELGEIQLETGDATEHTWKNFDSLASEAYLGRPFTSQPDQAVLKQNVSDVNLIIKKFLQNLRSQTPKGFRLCIAVPAWKSGQVIHLPLLEQLTDMGYTRLALKHVGFDDLIYAREGQIVGRELVILERS